MGWMPDTPKAPDPYQQATAQQGANTGAAITSAWLNNANEVNPYGSVTTKQTGTQKVKNADGSFTDVPTFTRTTELSPDQQKLLGLQTGMQTNLGELGVSQSSRLQGLLGTNLDTKGIQDWSAGKAPTEYDANAFSEDRSKVETALMDRYRTQSEPQRQAQEAQLAARGLAPGSQNWGSVQDAQNRQDTDQMSAAILAGGQEQSRLLGEQRSSWQQGQDYSSFLNNLRGGQLQERQTVRNAPINEITALMSGSQVSVPQFQPFSRQGVEAAPVGSYIGQNYANEANASANAMSGLFGLANTGMMLPFL